MGDLVQLKPTYSAKPVSFTSTRGYKILLSGTLDGYIDLSIETSEGNLTYLITPEDAAELAVCIAEVCVDINRNCLYDNDSLLMKPAP